MTTERDRNPQNSGRALRDTVRSLAERLGVKVAFVCEIVGARRDEARTLALAVDGRFLDEMTYKLAGTPCALVCEKGVAFLRKHAAEMYPEDRLLAEWAIDSYMGVAFFDADEELVGHVGVMHDGPLEDPAAVETELRSVALELGPRMEKRR